VYSTAVTVIQRKFRKHKSYLTRLYGPKCFIRSGKIRFYDKTEDAAATIQRTWKKFLNKEIYKFYCEMVKFREKLDPIVVLKGINPGEAKLIDVASAVHIRFRLGGLRFPPTVYYKIYTHNPVCDIGSFAPRDYTKHKIVKDARKTNSHGHTENIIDTTGWYKRVENNGWRPIADKLINDADFQHNDYTARASVRTNLTRSRDRQQEIKEFTHYSSLHRQQDLKIKRKKRKVEWMKKMYRENLLNG
jgi:hypothetical protein